MGESGTQRSRNPEASASVAARASSAAGRYRAPSESPKRTSSARGIDLALPVGEGEAGPFDAGVEVEGQLAPASRLDDEPVERLVVVAGVVMEGHQPPDASQGGEAEGVRDRAVAPGDVVGVLVAAVLGVVDEEVDPLRDLEPGDPVGGWDEADAQGRLVVRQIGERGAVPDDLVADGGAGVTDEGGPEGEGSDGEGRQ